MSMLQIEGLGTAYGKFQALRGIDMEVRAGEAVAVIGANGAGKTTLLRAISGMMPITEGRALMEGTDLGKLAPHLVVETGIAHVPEHRRLFPGLTVEANLWMGAYPRIARATARERLDHVYEIFPRMKERRHQLAGTMSGGEQQQCAIGRALMSNPRLILLDEPSTGLAPVIVAQVFDLVRRIRDEGYTVLIVEQNVQQVLNVVDRAYLIETGAIRTSGTADEMRHSEIVTKSYMGVAG